MKKLTFLFIAAVMAVSVSAQVRPNNPINTNNLFDVVWDCANEEFKTDYEVQFDETFTFAIDVTGTALVDWLQGTTAGATRSVGLKIYSDVGGSTGDFVDVAYRLTKIKGNIYGATWNLKQIAGGVNMAAATTTGAETYVYGVLFGYAYDATNGGVDWWQAAADISGPAEAGSPIFRAAAYNGSHASDAAFTYASKSPNGPFAGIFPDQAGWADHNCGGSSGLEQIVTNQQEVEYFQYFNLQGIQLQAEPAEGLFIAVPYYKNGVRGEAIKVLNRK